VLAEWENDISGMPDRFQDVSGVVLAGGVSSRYGENKALVAVEGIPLIERVLRTMDAIFHHVIVITNTPYVYAHLRVPMFEDVVKGLGPLGGIYTGLMAIPDSAGFFVACDMPFLNPRLIRHMVAIRDDFDVVAPRISGWIEALHGLYAKRCQRSIEQLIRSGVYQTFRFFPSVAARFVEDDEIRRFDPDMRSFLNINSPDELTRVRRPYCPDVSGPRDHAARRTPSASEADADPTGRG
jgi:molybdenum cofactor guanylyltransferase